MTSATDANSGQPDLFVNGPHVDDTAPIEKQLPSALTVQSVTPSQQTVTKGQTTDWYVDVLVQNTGQADLDLATLEGSDLEFLIGGQPVIGYNAVPTSVDPARRRLAAAETLTLHYTITQTGNDGGQVTIRATIDYVDANDLATRSSQGTAQITVENPAGLFILSTTAEPDSAPNSPQADVVLVNSAQQFQVAVTVQTTEEAVEDVRVELTSDGTTMAVPQGAQNIRIEKDQTAVFVFDVTAAVLDPGDDLKQETLTAKITNAISVNTQ
ncbi:MAG: hypothetical protein P8181_13960, partial [bacterium]